MPLTRSASKDNWDSLAIRHTTGSGKTLTSFKAAQIITGLPEVHKVVFCVDRKDLDYQTIREFNGFSKGSVDSTNNTKKLVQQFADDTKLIVTTLQKLNTAISKPRYLAQMEKLRDERIIFIFDECHRSQFGDTHKRITEFFRNHQLFGFTGTPIFAENALAKNGKKHTTKDLFHEKLHSYVITDAIKDENVLKFAVDYVGRYSMSTAVESQPELKVAEIDTREVLEDQGRIEAIVDYIIDHHSIKTRNKEFTAMLCVSSVDALIKYYEIFALKKEIRQHNLRIATIFSYTSNEEDKDADGILDEAIALFSNVQAKETIFVPPYEEYVKQFNEVTMDLLALTPTVRSVKDLPDEEAELKFVKIFRELMRLRNILESFSEFEDEDLALPAQRFADYRSAYLDLYDKVKTDNQKEKASILEDVDFELELIHRDVINVQYILKLLAQLYDADRPEQERLRKLILDTVAGDLELRTKRELIQKFIDQNLPKLENAAEIPDSFEEYWERERVTAFERLCKEEQLNADKLKKVIDRYVYTGEQPLPDPDIIELIDRPLKIAERGPTRKRVLEKVVDYVATFIRGIAA